MKHTPIDRDRCITNLYTLAKKKGILIRDLETSCGVSVGYLARLRQDKRKPLPGSDFLFRAADALDTSVDSLMYFNYQFASEKDLKLNKFIGKLIRDSLSEKIVWDMDNACYPSPVIRESQVSHPQHPLIALDPDLILENRSKEYYYSLFHPNEFNLIPRTAWRTSLSENVLLYLTRVSSGSDTDYPAALNSTYDSELGSDYIELYLHNTKEGMLSPLCCTSGDHPDILHEPLVTLYEAVAECLHCNVLDRCAISAIDDYLNDINLDE